MFDIVATTKALLKGCQIPSNMGVTLYTPDGLGNYRALWTRDFYYMVEYAKDLIDDRDVEACIQLLVDTARADGWIADRVEENGKAIYTAGDENFPVLPNLDNACFLCLCADAYLKTIDPARAKTLFLQWKDTLCLGLDCLPQNQNGFVINETTPLHSPYGFTDTVCKPGVLCFETLLLWSAQKALCRWMDVCGYSCAAYEVRNRSIEEHFMNTFLHESGMLSACTGKRDKLDLWASCLAVSIDFPMSQVQREQISAWMIKNYDSVVSHGQLRHLPANEYWDETFIPVEKGTYQNGAFWATPCVWLFDTLCVKDSVLAESALDALLSYFEKYGVFECINGEYKKLDTYVASAVPAYTLCKRIGKIN